ncbi:MAG: tetratricopeptide repeat protein [Pseudomonadota bacterium]
MKKAMTSLGIAVAGVLMSGAAQAETLRVEAVYAAQIDLPPGIETIKTERFGGDLGEDAAIAITERLSSITLDLSAMDLEPTRWFRVVSEGSALAGDRIFLGGRLGGRGPARAVRNPRAPDAILRGSVKSELIERRIKPRIEKECVKRDDDKKCVERKEIRIPCWQVTAEISPRIILQDRGGLVLHTISQPRAKTARYCEDQDVVSSLDMFDALIDDLAAQWRFALAPVIQTDNIRIMESRKDLAKQDRRAFRDAVKLTNTDPLAACDAFRRLEATNPAHVSVLYNIGLCHEAAGELEAARDYYSRALSQDPGREYPSGGIERISERERAAVQIAARFAPAS